MYSSLPTLVAKKGHEGQAFAEAEEILRGLFLGRAYAHP
jgi:hypothetical protein